MEQPSFIIIRQFIQKMDHNQKTLPPISRDPSKERENKLAKRLYKNNSIKKLSNTAEFSYLKNINPDSSILAGGSMTKSNSSKNFLIPSVSLKRNKELDMSQRSLQITHGKVLLSSPKNQEPAFLHYKGDLKAQLQKSSTKALFKKINRFDSINEKKIIPDELLGCSCDQEQSKLQKLESDFNGSSGSPKNSLSKGAKILKGFKNQSSKINEDEQVLTPMDFIQLVQEDGSITNEFCYLKKISHAYDLRIVEFQATSPINLSMQNGTMTPSMLSPTDEYITISSRGVSYFNQENSRFVPLERWKKQAFYFNKLMKLEFFSKYSLFKNFAKWKKYIRKTAMKSTTDKLRNQLMIGDKFLRRALLGVKDSCFVMESDTNYCKFDDCENVVQFSNFKSCQEQFIQNEFQKRILEIEEDIKNNLIVNMSDSMREFKEENKISTSNESKGIPLLIGDEKNLDMPYTKEATLRIQQQKFKKFLKLIEFMIVDSKIKMMSESTQKVVKKVQEENEAYEKQVIESKYKYPFKGKQYIKCAVKINMDEQTIQLKPTKEDLNYMFEEIVNRAVVKLCRNHKRIINDDDILQIIYDSNDKAIKQPQTNILKVIIMGDDRQEKIVNSLNQSINTTYSFLEKYSNRFTSLVEMYFYNLEKLNAISAYEAKDHEIIKQSLQKWKDQLTEINALSQEHQSAIFVLDFQDFKSNAIHIVTECLDKMKKVMPEIYLSTTKSLIIELEACLDKMKVKPLQIEDFIEFQKNKNEITNNMDSYADRLSEISCMWINIKENCSTSEIANITKIQQEQQLGKPQLKLNRLRTSLEEAEMNTKTYETNAQQLLKSRIPLIKDEIYKLYNNKMKTTKFDAKSNILEVSRAIEEYQTIHDNIIQTIKQIKEFQQQLSMEEYNEETMTKFSAFFSTYKKIWKLHQNMQLCKRQILSQPWTSIDIEQAKRQVDNYFNEAMKLKKDITTQSADDEEFKIPSSDISVLSDVFLEAKNMKPLVQTVECLRDKSLSEKEWKEIKSYFQKINKEHVCVIIDIENKEVTVSQIQEHKISEELDFIQSIVFRSKKQLEILSKINFVNKFWTEKNTDNMAKNLTENFQNSYWDIITEVDEKITVINGISEDSEAQAQEIKQGIAQNKNLLNSLRSLLTEWETHERYSHYFGPIFANPYWKSNPKEHKIYLQIDNNWNKLIKQCKDVSPKKLASNEKIIAIIRENIALFEQLKKTIEDFLNNKRDIFPKFYFLSNEQLIHVLQSEKQVRSIEQHINKVFTCVKSLEAKELGPIIVATDSQTLQVKFSKAFNNIEVEQIFKTLEQGIKSAVKSNLKNCLQVFEKDGDFNKRKWIKDHLLQSLIFIQNLEYTKIIEFDYMGNEEDDLSQYLIYQNTQIKELQSFLKENSDEPEMNPKKIETLIVQEILHRQITEMLLKNQIIEGQSYEWKKQIRCYNTNYSTNMSMTNTIANNENYFTEFLVNQVEYGLQFVNLQDAYPYVMLSEKEAIELSMALKLKHTPVIKGRENLILNFSKFNAKYYRNILCDSRLSEKYLANVCFGTYLEGCFVQFQQVQKLKFEQISVIANFMKEIYSTVNRNDKTFNFGCKKNPLNLATIGSGIILKLSDLPTMSEFTQKIPFNNKILEFKTMPYGLYVNLMMQIWKKNHKNIGSKLIKFVDLIHEVEGYQIFSFDHIRNLLKKDNLKDVQNLDSYFAKEILNIVSETLVSAKKIAFYKQILFDIFFQDKYMHEKMSQSSLHNSKTVKEKDLKYFVNSLVEITEKKSVCVIAGPTQSGKISLISEAYKQRICRGFEVQIVSLDILNQEALFGCYVNGLWMEGILIRKIKQLPLSKEDWIVFEGSYCQKIVDIIHRLNHRYLQLSNGQIVFLSPSWKLIFSIYNFEENYNNLPRNIDVLQSASYINIKDSTEIMVEKRIKPHFERDQGNKSLQNYSLIENKCGSRELKSMKIMGVKNQYLKAQNILRYLINILDALLADISPDIKAHKEFSKGIQKIFTWSIYWCIGSCLPSQFAKKYESSLFENSKGDIEFSQNLGEIRIEFDTPAGSLKKIKHNEIKKINNEVYYETLDLKSKACFVEMMIKSNFPIILIGKPGSGKSKFMEYLQITMNQDQHTYLSIRLRKQMSYEEFKDILLRKTRISIKATRRKCFSSSTNKKLVILIDDFNLLDLESQIGEFLMTCIKNGYYYDTSTNEKIHINNISFIVAENDNYESRIDNRFLKYFKPIYINEIELKKVAEIYSNDLPDVKYAREIFQACESFHSNFIMNLQTNQEIKRPFPFSHQNAIRVMQCIKDYAEKDIKLLAQGKEKRENLAKVWAYTSKLEYIGFSLSPEIEEKIEKEIKNRLNLIIQNSNQKPKPVPHLSDLITELVKKNNLLKADGQHEEYYEYLAFLISMSQSRNLLTIGEPLPQNIKAEILNYIAEAQSLKFYHLKNTQTLKNIEFRNSLIYLSTEKFEELLNMLGFITNNAECKNARYVLDCQNRAEFDLLIKYVPHVSSMFNFFTKKISLTRILISPQYSEWLTKFQDHLGRKLSQREELTIISNLLEKQKELKVEISTKKKTSGNFIACYHQLSEEIQANISKVEEIKLNIKEWQEKQEYNAFHKKQMSQTLTGLNNTKLQDEAEEERIQNIKKLKEQINEAENEAKEIKNKKKILSEKISQIENNNKLSKQISTKLAPRYEEFLQTHQRIQAIENSESSILFCLSLYYFGVKNQNHECIEFVQKQDELKSINLDHVIKVIFDINPSDIRKEVLVWVLENKSILVKDKSNRFLKFIKKAVPRIRIINEPHALNNNFLQPVIYTGRYDPFILNVPHLTYIIKQEPAQIAQELKYLTLLSMNDSPQNHRETIKLSIYSHKEKQMTYQISALQQEIHQIYLQISMDQENSLKIFLDPTQRDFKRLRNLLYSQWDRLYKLQQNLKIVLTGLDAKYQSILDTCCLFKKISDTIQDNADYFKFTDKQFEEVILRSAGIKPSSERTSKKLVSHGLISKKSLCRAKSRKQIEIDVVASNTIIEPSEPSDLLNAAETQLPPKQITPEVNFEVKEEKIFETEENSMEQFNKRMINEFLSKIILGLKSEDSLFAYLTIACFMNEHQFTLSSLNRQVLTKIIKKQTLAQESLLEVQIQIETAISKISLEAQESSRLIQILQALRNVFQAYKQDPNSTLQKVIKFADATLEKFYDDLLKEKYYLQLLNSKENIVIISNQRQNPFQILQTYILNTHEDDNWCYMFENQINAEKIAEMSEKSSINLFIIINNQRATLFEQLKEIQKQKDLTFIFLYPNQSLFFDLKKNISASVLRQIQEFSFVYAQDPTFIYKKISETYLYTFSKFTEERFEIQQLARIIFYDEATEMLNRFYKSKISHNYQEFYFTKMFKQILSKLPNVSFNQAAKILVKICYQDYKDKQCIVVKQAKKIINKKESLISTFIEFFNKDYHGCEEITFDGSAFISENPNVLIDNFSQCSPQEIVNMLIPQTYRKKYPLDTLYISGTPLKTQNTHQKPSQKEFSEDRVMTEISKILNELQINVSLESQNSKKEKQFHKDLVQDEIRFKMNGLRKIEENLKKYRKLLEAPTKIFSDSTENELKNLSKHVMKLSLDPEPIPEGKSLFEMVQEYVTREQKSLEYLDKLYLNKQSQKVFDPSHFRYPAQFIKYYLYESNPHINLKTGEIQARYLTEKEKEAHYDVTEECKSLLINQIVVKNAKFDQNKNILEPNDKQESSKIPNVHICLSDKPVSHLNSSLPVYFNNNQLFNLLVINKVKDESLWKGKTTLCIESK